MTFDEVRAEAGLSPVALVQGTEEWRLARAGKATASEIHRVVARTKSGWGAERANYLAELVVERVTGRPKDTYVSTAMKQGTLREPIARALYSALFNVEVVQLGFVNHPTIAMSGVSPDGNVGEIGGIEIKCPEKAEHVRFLRTRSVKSEYLKQMAWNFSCQPARQWIDFISYNPDLEGALGFKDMSFVWKRITRKGLAEIIAELEKEVPIFLKEVDDEIAALRAVYGEDQAVAA